MGDDLEKVSEKNKSTMESLKTTVSLLKERKYKEAGKEGLACTYNLSKDIYNEHLKDKYVEVKGKKIPRTAIAIAAVVILFIFCPDGCSDNEAVAPKNVTEQSSKTKAPENTYDKNGVKVYNLEKCEQAVCGILENTTDYKYAKISIDVTFHNDKDEVIYEGYAEATDVIPSSRMRLNIPSGEPFSYFKLQEVVVEK